MAEKIQMDAGVLLSLKLYAVTLPIPRVLSLEPHSYFSLNHVDHSYQLQFQVGQNRKNETRFYSKGDRSCIKIYFLRMKIVTVMVSLVMFLIYLFQESLVTAQTHQMRLASLISQMRNGINTYESIYRPFPLADEAKKKH